MISCLPSLYLAGFAAFKAFVGEFSAVALMEARDKEAGAMQSPVQALHPSSANTSVPALRLWVLLSPLFCERNKWEPVGRLCQ